MPRSRLILPLVVALLIVSAAPVPARAGGPGLFLKPTSGPVGTVVTADASGFGPNRAIQIRWDSRTGQLLRSTTTNSSGSFSTTITVPSSSNGGHTVVACESFNNGCPGGEFAVEATRTFTVTAPPTTTTTATTAKPTTTTTAKPTTTTTTAAPGTTTPTTAGTTQTTAPPPLPPPLPVIPEEDLLIPIDLSGIFAQPPVITEAPPGPLAVLFDPEFSVLGAGMFGGPSTVLPIGPTIAIPPEGFQPRCDPPRESTFVDFDDLVPGVDARNAHRDVGVRFDVGSKTRFGEVFLEERPLVVETADDYGTISSPNTAFVENRSDELNELVRMTFDEPQRVVGVYVGEPDGFETASFALTGSVDDREVYFDRIAQSGLSSVTTCMLVFAAPGQPGITSVDLSVGYSESNLRLDRVFFSDDVDYRLPDVVVEGEVVPVGPRNGDEVDVSEPISLTGYAGPTVRPGATNPAVDTVRLTYVSADGLRHTSVEAETRPPRTSSIRSHWRLDGVELPLGTSTIAVTATGPGVIARTTYTVEGVDAETRREALTDQVDIIPLGIEVNQAISGTVPLAEPGSSFALDDTQVAGRATAVRAYAVFDFVGADRPPDLSSIPVDAIVLGFKNHRLLPGGPLRARDPYVDLVETPATQETLDDMRTRATASWNFSLPLEWTEAGDLDLFLLVNPPGPVHIDEVDDGEPNTLFADNISFSVIDPRPLHLALVDFTWNFGAGEQNAGVDLGTLGRALDQWERMYPVPYGGLPLGSAQNFEWSLRPCDDDEDNPQASGCSRPAVAGIPQWANQDVVDSLPTESALGQQLYIPTIFNPISPIGCSGAAGLSGTNPLFHGGACGATLAQEAAHTHGITHLSGAHNEPSDGPFITRFADDHAEFEADAVGWNIGTWQPVLGTVGDVHTHDFMSYGGAPNWVTLSTWKRVAEALRASNTVGPTDGPVFLRGPVGAAGGLVIVGTVGAEPALVEALLVDEASTYTSPDTATHEVVLRDASGAELARHPVFVGNFTHPVGPLEFVTAVPAVDGVVSVDLVSGGDVLSTVDVELVDSPPVGAATALTVPGPWGELFPVIRSPRLAQVIEPTSSVRFDVDIAGGIPGDAVVAWTLDGAPVGDDLVTFLGGLEIGRHELAVVVTVDDRSGTVSLPLVVDDDADHDGLGDTWETDHGLDPADPEDASGDGDDDGLTNLAEQEAGSDPDDVDSDGDDFADAVEVNNGTDPADADEFPIALVDHYGAPISKLSQTPGNPESSGAKARPLIFVLGLLVPLVAGAAILVRRRRSW